MSFENILPNKGNICYRFHRRLATQYLLFRTNGTLIKTSKSYLHTHSKLKCDYVSPGQSEITYRGVGIMLQGITLQNWNYAAAKFLKKVMLQGWNYAAI